MPQYQPRPLVVIRNQLLAFLVLHLLGSCAPIQSAQPSSVIAGYCCSPDLPAATVLPNHFSPNTPYRQSR
jgi:hypothetical protein